MRKSYALFDFDGTLRAGDSIVSLCVFAHRRGLCPARALWRGALAAAGYGLRLLSDRRAKEAAMGWIKGKTVEELREPCQVFCEKELVPKLYAKGVERLAAERARGATVLLVTASPSFYLEPLKELLPVDDIIGTRMAVDVKGRYTGDICGDNCRGLQKPLRLAEYLAAAGDRLDYDQSRAYGDSKGDLPMLELCREKVGVNPKPGLRRALEGMEGATIVRWASPEGSDLRERRA